MEGSASTGLTNTAKAAVMSADVVAMLRARDEQIAAQGEQIAALKHQLDWFRRQVFGQKSERFIAEPNPAQLHLGDALPVPDANAAESADRVQTIPAHGRRVIARRNLVSFGACHRRKSAQSGPPPVGRESVRRDSNRQTLLITRHYLSR